VRGQFTSKALHAHIEKGLEQHGETLEAAIRNAFLRTHEEFSQLMPEEKSGTTATIAMVSPTQLAVANVGDSRAILCCDADGRPVQLTVDHTASLPEERARIEALGGSVQRRPGGVWRLEGQLAVTRSIGDLSRGLDRYIAREPHVLVRDLQPTDAYLVVASDGLWDVMSNEEVVEFIQMRVDQPVGGATPNRGKVLSLPAPRTRPYAPDLQKAVDLDRLAQELTWEVSGELMF
jgi:serine/threonine protein phosphatase PrpC